MSNIAISLLIASLCTTYFVYTVRRGDDNQAPIDFALIRTGVIIFVVAAGIVYFIANKDRNESSYDYREDLDYCERYNCRGTR